MARFEIRVNGVPRIVEDEPGTPLLWVLRDRLGLTGTKYGCGQGHCGACLVLEGDEPVRSCLVTLARAAGRSFTTIEGLSEQGEHPVQRAWLEENVSQCGYCQPGMVLEVAALLRRSPRPTKAEVDEALGEHLCRCGTYPRVRRAVERLAGGSGS